MTVISARLSLQQRVFPEYRAPFFNLLAQSCLQGFSLFSGEPRPEEAITTTPGLQNGDFQPAQNLHISKGKTYALYQRGIINRLERWQPNVLIVESNPRYLSTPAAVQWMHNRGLPVIGWGLGAPPAGKAESLLRNSFLNSLEAVIAYSKSGAEQYAACGLAPQRIFVAANAVAHRPTQNAPDRPTAYQGGKPNLLFVGRLQERKNLDLLLQACAALPAKLTPYLTIVGDGPDRARLEALAKNAFPAAQFTGAKHGAELEPYFNKADLFVLPGTGGLAIQQAMAHALPVIVGQADGTQGELVRPENGVVLARANLETLTAALTSALSDINKLRAMGLASYRIVTEEVNLEAMVDSFCESDKISLMKLLLIADGRSPITRRWIAMLAPLKYELVLISSYPCDPIDGLQKLYILPLAFASQGGSQAGSGSASLTKQLVSRFRPIAQRMRHLLGPWMLSRHVNEYLDILKNEKPDRVHAFRIPFEGMLTSTTPPGYPLILSTWGNDFTLHASSTGRMEVMTRKALRRADALMSDTQCDLQRAQEWGFDPQKPSLVVPGNGGTDVDELAALTKGIERVDPPQVINPRGLRSYVRTDTFFKAIPLVLAKQPDVQFVCASMEGQSEALNWVEQLGIENNIRFLPYVSQPELWSEYARSQVMVSNSTHDGSPNSLLEAMALGCFPVCGNIESIRAWIKDGENGLLVDPANPSALAHAILKALENTQLRATAAKRNAQLIREKAGIDAARAKVRELYERVG